MPYRTKASSRKEANGFRKKTCSNKAVEPDDDSKRSHPELAVTAPATCCAQSRRTAGTRAPRASVEAEEEHHPEQAERRNAGHRHPVRLAAHRVVADLHCRLPSEESRRGNSRPGLTFRRAASLQIRSWPSRRARWRGR